MCFPSPSYLRNNQVDCWNDSPCGATCRPEVPPTSLPDLSLVLWCDVIFCRCQQCQCNTTSGHAHIKQKRWQVYQFWSWGWNSETSGKITKRYTFIAQFSFTFYISARCMFFIFSKNLISLFKGEILNLSINLNGVFINVMLTLQTLSKTRN